MWPSKCQDTARGAWELPRRQGGRTQRLELLDCLKGLQIDDGGRAPRRGALTAILPARHAPARPVLLKAA